nr:hypothetical protein GCM10017745_44100 [Saccharothrix mutabilis subsp. capreolus]
MLSTARRLRDRGFTPGTRMLFSVRPGPDAIVLALGTVAAGGTVVFVDPGVGRSCSPDARARRGGLGGGGVRAVRGERAGPAAGAGPPARPAAAGLLRAAGAAHQVRAVAARRAARRGVHEGLGETVADAPFPEADPDQDAVVVFTSGTTAAPKAVVHTRGSLAAALDALATRCALGPDTRVHTDQMMLGLPALVAGAHWSLPPHGFAPAADPTALAAGLDGATHTFLVPTDLAAVLDSGVALPRSLRQVLLGSAPVLPPLLERARRALPDVEFLAVYGMTEILPVAIATGEEKIAHGGDLLGRPLPGVRARIADDGELLVSGPNLCRGYLGEPPLTEHATGDLARLDGDRLVLTGRKKDMILRGGVNVYPACTSRSSPACPGSRRRCWSACRTRSATSGSCWPWCRPGRRPRPGRPRAGRAAAAHRHRRAARRDHRAARTAGHRPDPQARPVRVAREAGPLMRLVVTGATGFVGGRSGGPPRRGAGRCTPTARGTGTSPPVPCPTRRRSMPWCTRRRR